MVVNRFLVNIVGIFAMSGASLFLVAWKVGPHATALTAVPLAILTILAVSDVVYVPAMRRPEPDNVKWRSPQIWGCYVFIPANVEPGPFVDWTWRNTARWVVMGLLVMGVVIMVAGDYSQIPGMIKLGVAWFSICLLWIPIIWFGTKEPVLFVGMLPSAALWYSIAILQMTAQGEGDYVVGIFLANMPLWFILILWAPVTWLFFWGTRRWSKKRLLLRPLTELVSVTLLMIPWFLAAFVLPHSIDANHQTLTIMASIGIGIVWGRVVSEPFARVVAVLRAHRPE